MTFHTKQIMASAFTLMACVNSLTSVAQDYVYDTLGDQATTPIIVNDLGGSVYTPMIVVGDPAGTPAITPAGRVNPNVSSSFAAGVVSIFLDTGTPGDGIGGICTGTLISPTHILTAAHCVDVTGGTALGGGVTGDGASDTAIGSSSVVFNHSGSLAAVVGINSITIHPDWEGFNNTGASTGANINDDFAIIELSAPAPAGVPIYPLNTDPFTVVESVIMVGYGTTGDGVSGFVGGSSSFDTKRDGQNLASGVILDDEAPGTDPEMWLFDFDGPDLSTSTLDGSPTFGNNIEVNIGPGDSGGPAFLWADDGDSIPEADEMALFGTNTFGAGGGSIPASPLFGSQGGGMLISNYEPWIQSVIPEPSSLALLGLGGLLVARRRRG